MPLLVKVYIDDRLYVTEDSYKGQEHHLIGDIVREFSSASMEKYRRETRRSYLEGRVVRVSKENSYGASFDQPVNQIDKMMLGAAKSLSIYLSTTYTMATPRPLAIALPAGLNTSVVYTAPSMIPAMIQPPPSFDPMSMPALYGEPGMMRLGAFLPRLNLLGPTPYSMEAMRGL
jgi:hypothetical protein